MGGMHIVYKQEVVRQPLVNSESRNLDFLGVLAAQSLLQLHQLWSLAVKKMNHY